MNDRELLELAANAAGYKTIQYKDLKADALDVRYGIDEAIWNGENYWNPLVDDGDALRLAVKLELDIGINTHKTHVQDTFVITPSADLMEMHNSDPYAATRRAIVRAAAAIGKEQL